ncbi:unnamed protein product [Coffea canephora]|uniref:BRCT domain-containing protein n=1 Tax=Coffea canephora TaxID=49390 RepID=A0A068TRU2_COFCA|nr:unnamed protein product [Coffea canephora]
MSESEKASSGNGRSSAGTKRNLPSWMSAREERDSSGGKNKEPKSSASASNSGSHDFSKLMEGVVFVLSGFVNPERGELRSRALEMGAEYQPDWNSNCTLLICAFPNTPKFRQVEADSGTIVSKEWILECHEQKKLMDIEPYLLYPGKPWRRQSVPREASNDCRATTSLKLQKNVEKRSCTLPTNGASEDQPSNQVSDCFSPSRVKKWASDDLSRTLSWLESQDEKPEQSEIKKIAAEGILTCLQDAIDALKQGQLILQITEQWACVPRMVEELMKFDGTEDDSASVSKKYVCRHAVACKQIYENEYRNLEDDSSPKKKSKTNDHGKCGNEERTASKGGDAYESDDTVEMTEEEIDRAYNTISATLLLDAG